MFVVAASDSRNPQNADYVCDGVDDQIEIQAAIDAIPTSGGTVELKDGTFHMTGRLRIWRSRLSIIGQGPTTVLYKETEVTKVLASNAPATQGYVEVADPTGLRVGMTIIVYDDNRNDYAGISGGGASDSTMGEITNIVGTRVYVWNNMKFTYTVAANAKLKTQFAMVQSAFDEYLHGGERGGAGTYLTRILLKDFRIEGNVAGQTYPVNQFMVGMWTYEWRWSRITGIEIANWYTDAFSLQGIYDGVVEHCIMWNPGRYGVHFGGFLFSQFHNNHAYYGVWGGDHYRLCSGSMFSTFSDNSSDSSLGHGWYISMGGGNHDSVFTGNIVENSLQEGLYISGNALDRNNLFIGCGFIETGTHVAIQRAVYLINTQGWSFVGCRVRSIGSSGPCDAGFYIETSHDVDIRSCDVHGFRTKGIHLKGSDRVNIVGNKVFDNTVDGIYVENSDDAFIAMNDCGVVDGAQTNGITVDVNSLRAVLVKSKNRNNGTAQIVDAGVGTGPRVVQTIQAFLAYSTNGVLAASFNGTFSATAQPDVARNLVYKKTGATANGGQVIVTGLDQFGNVVTETTVFAGGAATTVGTKVLASIGVSGIVISALTAGDTIEVGVGNKLGLDHKIFPGAVKKCCKSGVGDYAAGITEDSVYHGVAMAANIAANDIYQIISMDCLA
jgi:parallel beta-helix repeat protein